MNNVLSIKCSCDGKNSAAAVSWGRFGGISCNDHGTNKKHGKNGVCVFSAGTQWSVLHRFNTDWHPLRWTGSASGVPSPSLERVVPPVVSYLMQVPEKQVWTHTHTHSCLARDISTKLLLLLSMILLAPLRTVSRSGVPCITSSNRWSEQHEALSARSPREAGVSRTDRSGGNTFH